MKSQRRSQVLAAVCVVLGATFLWGCMVGCAKLERKASLAAPPPSVADGTERPTPGKELERDEAADAPAPRRQPMAVRGRYERVAEAEEPPPAAPEPFEKPTEVFKKERLAPKGEREGALSYTRPDSTTGRAEDHGATLPAPPPVVEAGPAARPARRPAPKDGKIADGLTSQKFYRKLSRAEAEKARRLATEATRKRERGEKPRAAGKPQEKAEVWTRRTERAQGELREKRDEAKRAGKDRLIQQRAAKVTPLRRPSAGSGGRGPAVRTVGGKVDAALLARQMAATDELWVIERPSIRDARPTLDDDSPTQGQLRARVPGQAKEVPLPLKHTDVKAQVSAFIATVNVTQEYHNPYGVKIEAVYVFPLPQNAAVTEFVMTIGKRRIRGIIREREEARKIYEEAKRQGYVASLLTQERPNIFTQRVANIEPQKDIDVTITYFNTLKYGRGEYEFVFPMVVGPRYNPPGWKDGVGAVARGEHGRSGQPVEVQHLKPGERSGHDIGVTLDIDAGVEVEEVTSPSHAIEVERSGPSLARVRLSRLDAIPNKDLVVRYKVAGKKLKTALMTHRGEKGNHFALVLQPPADLAYLQRVPREMVFVLDCSGSMRGRPMGKAKEAIRRCLKKLDPDDTFQVIRFSSNASKLGRVPLSATPANVESALRFVDGLRGSGGTRMIEGIKAALDFAHDPRRFRVVSFMTDGYIGNESQILAAVHDKLGDARIFSFGVGNSVNRYLLESMARMGRGAVAFVGLDEGAGREVDLFYERCSRPALTDIEIDWGGMEVDSIYPRRIPDLFVGRPVLLTGRFEGRGPTTVRVMGRTGSYEQAFEVKVDLDDETARHSGVTKLWARKKLAELAATHTHSPSRALREEMTALSLEYSVQCRYTAFLAVDSSRRTAGDRGISVKVPVPVPDGVEYETTVDE